MMILRDYKSIHTIMDLGKICIKFDKVFDQHWVLTTRGDNFFLFFLTSVNYIEK